MAFWDDHWDEWSLSRLYFLQILYDLQCTSNAGGMVHRVLETLLDLKALYKWISGSTTFILGYLTNWVGLCCICGCHYWYRENEWLSAWTNSCYILQFLHNRCGPGNQYPQRALGIQQRSNYPRQSELEEVDLHITSNDLVCRDFSSGSEPRLP